MQQRMAYIYLAYSLENLIFFFKQLVSMCVPLPLKVSFRIIERGIWKKFAFEEVEEVSTQQFLLA